MSGAGGEDRTLRAPYPRSAPAGSDRTPAPLRLAIERLGVVMAPDPARPDEQGGVLNPGGVRGPDGAYYLFPRLVAPGNYSRIGVARVRRDAAGHPRGVERLGIALEPEAPYEIVAPGIAGCEDPRVTRLPDAGGYLMVYSALGADGPRVALAASRDLLRWRRLGLVGFAAERRADFAAYVNKDALLFPTPVRAPGGAMAIALLHRPLYECWPGGTQQRRQPLPWPAGIADGRGSIWLSYCPLSAFRAAVAAGVAPRFGQHHPLASPVAPWEASHIGAGSVPHPLPGGWLTLYHGVERRPDGRRCYRAGALLLDRRDPRRVLARSREPLLAPEVDAERSGVVDEVVFPTAVEPRTGARTLYVYYGMADCRIGVAELTVGRGPLRPAVA